MTEGRITVLVENSTGGRGLLAEHGLSVWIEYGSRRILFDTGQSDILFHNARVLGIDLSTVDSYRLGRDASGAGLSRQDHSHDRGPPSA